MRVSIPSNGSIQFLHLHFFDNICKNNSLNPLKRVNSILTPATLFGEKITRRMSQSPQTGQFNSYSLLDKAHAVRFELSQSPQTGQFNSYAILRPRIYLQEMVSIPSNGSIQFLQVLSIAIAITIAIVSIPSNGSIQFLPEVDNMYSIFGEHMSQSPQTGQFNSY